MWKTPDQKPNGRDTYIAITKDGLICAFVSPKMCDDGVARWMYLPDLIAAADRAERLQKAVDFAVDYLEQVATHAKTEEDNFAAQVIKRKIDEIKQLIKE